MLRNDGVAFQSGLYKVKYLKSKCTKILLVSECKSNLGLNMSNAKPKYQCLWGSFKSNFQSFINSPVSGSPISLQRAILNRFEAIHAIERSHSAEEQHVCFSYIYIYIHFYIYIDTICRYCMNFMLLPRLLVLWHLYLSACKQDVSHVIQKRTASRLRPHLKPTDLLAW